MPSPSATALASGFACLQTESGEALTFRAGSVTGVVDRTPERPENERPDFTAKSLSVVELVAGVVAPAPAVGEKFIDANGQTHRILTAPRRLGDVWRMTCEVSG